MTACSPGVNRDASGELEEHPLDFLDGIPLAG
jgi:hypothetical protein